MSDRLAFTHRLESRSLDVVHVERYGEEPFTFLPFDDVEVTFVEFLDDEHLLVLAWRKLAIWHLPSRRQIALATPLDHWNNPARTFSAARGSLFIQEYGKKDEIPSNHIREVSLDGSLDRRFAFDRRVIFKLGAHADGRIVAFCRDPEHRYYFAVLDSETGAVEEHDLPAGFHRESEDYGGFRISPDGCLAVRAHLGSVARFPQAAREWFEQPDSRAAFDANRWPDRSAADVDPCYGYAYEIYDTLTGRLTQRLLGGLMTVADIQSERSKSGWNEAFCRHGQAIIDRVADAFPYAGWDGRRQIIFSYVPYADKAAHDAEAKISFPFRFLLRRSVSWSGDGSGLVVPAGPKGQRTIRLDGQVGPIEPAPAWVYNRAPKAAVAKISRELTERSTVSIVVPDETATGALAALTAMAERIEGGIATLLFRDALTFVFKSGRRRIGETTFFKELRQFDPAPLLPPLRRIVGSFGAQTRTGKPEAHEQLMLGERSRAEDWRTALAPAALLLAEADMDAGDFLRDWFLCVDQEHDYYAATKVMVAFARASGFGSEGAVRFGLFFLLQQWQTLSYNIGRLRLIEAARRYPAATVAGWIAEERTYIEIARQSGPTAGSGLIASLLKPGKAWDHEVLSALNF